MSKNWIVYILKCADNTLYTGITNDIEKRINKHNKGTASKYTRVRTPVMLVYKENQPDRSAATKKEAEIKKLTRIQKEKLITKLH